MSLGVFRILILFFLTVIASGCATNGNMPMGSTQFTKPTDGMTGIYFYQWKKGIIGAAYDVRFVLDDKVLGQINTGEYMYFEVSPGVHKVRILHGLSSFHLPVEFKADMNYFFRGHISGFSQNVIWVNDDIEIQEVVKNIKSGWYEAGDLD